MKKFAGILLLIILAGVVNTGAYNDDNFNFIVFGDSRPSFQGAPIPFAYKRILEEVNLINPDFIVHTGDLIYGYGDSEDQLKTEYQTAKNLMATVITKSYYVPGNHDFQTDSTTKYFKDLAGEQRDYYTFNYKGALFIILNTEIPGQVGEVSGDQLKWLSGVLDDNQDARAIFVFMHRPLFSSIIPNADTALQRPGPMTNFNSNAARWSLIKLLVKYKITTVFSGHEHLYHRVDYKGVPFITLGGGGATFSAPPEKGGFFNYMIVSLKEKNPKYNLMEPFQFSVDSRTYVQNGKNYGEAVIHNIHGEVVKGSIPIAGMKFTLPKGKYIAKADCLVPPSQIVKAAEAIGSLKIAGPGREKFRDEEVRDLIAPFIRPRITKVEPNKADNKMQDVWVTIEAPGTLSIRVIVSPE